MDRPDRWKPTACVFTEWDESEALGMKLGLSEDLGACLVMADATYWLEVRLDDLRKDRSLFRSGSSVGERAGLSLGGWVFLGTEILLSTTTCSSFAKWMSFTGSLAPSLTVSLGWPLSTGFNCFVLRYSALLVFSVVSETGLGVFLKASMFSLVLLTWTLLWCTGLSCLSFELQNNLALPWRGDSSLQLVSNSDGPPTLFWEIPPFTMFPWSSILMAPGLNRTAGSPVAACTTEGFEGTTVNVFMPKRDVMRVILLGEVLELELFWGTLCNSSAFSVDTDLWVVAGGTGFFSCKDSVLFLTGSDLISVLLPCFCMSTLDLTPDVVLCLSSLPLLMWVTLISLIFASVIFSFFSSSMDLFVSDSLCCSDWDDCFVFAALLLLLSAAVQALLFLFCGLVLDWWQKSGSVKRNSQFNKKKGIWQDFTHVVMIPLRNKTRHKLAELMAQNVMGKISLCCFSCSYLCCQLTQSL